jgi:hypothetical protein
MRPTCGLILRDAAKAPLLRMRGESFGMKRLARLGRC